VWMRTAGANRYANAQERWTICRGVTNIARRFRPFGRGIPTTSRLWRAYYQIFGVPVFRTQLFWRYVLQFVEGVRVRRWLDVGCGGGAFVVELARLMPAASFVGIDRDSKAIWMANKLASAARIANVTWEKTELDEFSGGKFDVVSALGLIESSPDPATFLARLADHAQEGGRIIFTAPHAWSVNNIQPAVDHRFSKAQLRQWMQDIGLQRQIITEGAKGLALRAYAVSQRLDSPALAAALYLFTFSLVALDPVLPGRGGILFCAGDVRRRPGNQSGGNSDDSHSR